MVAHQYCSPLRTNLTYILRTWQVSLSGHLFDQFLINEALDVIEAAGGSFHLVKCQLGQCTDAMSYSELEVSHLMHTYIGIEITSMSSIFSRIIVVRGFNSSKVRRNIYICLHHPIQVAATITICKSLTS